jgi:hypothetical protein
MLAFLILLLLGRLATLVQDFILQPKYHWLDHASPIQFERGRLFTFTAIHFPLAPTTAITTDFSTLETPLTQIMAARRSTEKKNRGDLEGRL